MLSHDEILKAQEAGDLSIEPFLPELVKRNSVLLRLGDRFREIKPSGVIDVGDPESLRAHEGAAFEARDVVVSSDRLLLAASFERIALAPDLVGVLSGISNVARLGVLVHATSEFVNAGFGFGDPSRVIFELATVGSMRVRLRTGIPLCHLALFRLNQAPSYCTPSARTGQDVPGFSDLHSQFGRYIIGN
jgi:dCTP deaminase